MNYVTNKNWLSAAAILLILLLFPLAHHWIIVYRPVVGVYYQQTSFIVYLSDVAVVLLLLVEGVWGGVNKDPSPISTVHLPAEGVVTPPHPDENERQTHHPGRVVLVPLALLMGLILFSVVGARDEALTLYLGVRWLGLFLLVGAVRRLRPRPSWLVVGMAVTLVVQAIIALAQFGLQNDLGWQALGEVELGVTGLVSVIRVGETPYIRGYGLTPHPNILGGVLMALLFPILMVFLQAGRRGRVLWLLILAVGVGGLLVSFSRSAWVGGVVGGAVLLVVLWRTPAWRRAYGRLVGLPVALALGLMLLFIALRPDLFLARLRPSASYTETRSLSERDTLAALAWQMIDIHPLSGLGAGGFAPAIAAHTSELTNVRPQPVHMIPLLAAAEVGWLGGVLWVWLMIAPFWGMIQVWRRGRLTLWGLGLTASLLVLAVTDLFDYYSWGWAQGRLWRCLLWGLWLSEMESGEKGI